MRRFLLLGMAVLLGMMALPSYGQTIDYTPVSSIGEIKHLAEGTKVALICNNNVAVTTSDMNPTFLKDWTGAMAVNEVFAECYKYLKGTLYGTYTRENGVTELKDIEFDGTWDKYIENYEADEREITEDEYWDYECQLVSMPITTSFSVICFNAYGTNVNEYIPHNQTTVTGYVYPTPDHKKRFIYNGWGNGVNIDFYDNTTNTITSQDSQFKILYEVHRSFNAGCWYSIVLPGSYSTYNCTLAEFVSANDGVLTFKTATSFKAGKPYLIKFNSDVDKISGSYISVNSDTPQTVSGGEYNFVGTYSPVQPKDGSYYLTANNTIRPLASGGTIKGFRAYFEPASPNAAKARAFCIDGVTTAIEDIVGGEELFGIPQKVYTVNGQYAGDDLEALPKGVYIVNGKKIIK